MFKIKKIHLIGIKGVGMTPVAVILKEAGFEVSGCDVGENFITDETLEKAEILPQIGFSEEHIKNADFVIATGAHQGYENTEVQAALEKGLDVAMQGEVLGGMMDGKLLEKKFDGISVAGCHGKTTTTAMIVTIFQEAGLDPTYAIGTSMINGGQLPGHFGTGQYFIAEADEYATEPKYYRLPKFLWQHPKIAVITNIEYDHPDIYPSIESLEDAYLLFAKNINPNGILITCGDDQHVQNLLRNYKGRVITYGFQTNNDFLLQKVSVSEGQTIFRAASKTVDFGELVLNVIGEHQALNALVAAIAAHEAGIKLEDIKKGLFLFKGTKRRTELVGKTPLGAFIYDDYAHHPTEIKRTLEAIRAYYPDKRIVSIFQPHTYSRTKLLFDQFSTSFVSADLVILTDIFASAREKKDPSVSSEDLVKAIAKHGKDSICLPNLEDVIQYVNEKKFGGDTVIVIMGAGDVYKIVDKLYGYI